jgi:hypothetical protein
MHRPRVVLYFTLLLASAASADAAESVEVRLRSSAVCQATIVRLSDVAELLGDESDLNEALGAIAVAPAPAAGSSRELSQQELRQILTISGIERTRYVLTGSESVLLEVKGDLVSRPVARQTLTDIRTVAAELEIVPAEKRKLRPQAYAERPKQPRLPQPAPPRLVERGAALTVYSRAAGVQITEPGKSLGHGSMGETIPVELADSRERILAKIVGPQTVEVGLPSKPLTTIPIAASQALSPAIEDGKQP